MFATVAGIIVRPTEHHWSWRLNLWKIALVFHFCENQWYPSESLGKDEKVEKLDRFRYPFPFEYTQECVAVKLHAYAKLDLHDRISWIATFENIARLH